MKYSSEPCNTSRLPIFIMKYSSEPCNTSSLPIFLPVFILKYSSEPCNTSSLHIFILNYSNEPCNTSILPIFILKYSNEPCNTSILPNKQHILKQSTNFRNVLPTGHISNFSIFNYRLILKTLLYQGLFLILILTNCIKHSFAQNNPFWNNQLISEMSFR